MSKNNKLPQLRNPMNDLIMGNMPGLPEIIKNSMPVELPRASYQQNSVSLFFGNIKRNQLVKSVKAEAEIAEYSRQAVSSKLGTVHEIITFSSKVADTIGAYEHNKDMRRIEFQKGDAEIRLLDLEAVEKKANIQQTQFQTALIAQEVEIAKIETQIKMKQLKEILNDDNVIDA